MAVVMVVGGFLRFSNSPHLVGSIGFSSSRVGLCRNTPAALQIARISCPQNRVVRLSSLRTENKSSPGGCEGTQHHWQLLATLHEPTGKSRD